MNVKTLICYRKGVDPFRYDDMNARAFGIEPEFDAFCAAVYPQPRPGCRNQVIEDLLQTAEEDSDTYVVVRSWTREAPLEPLKNALPRTKFDGRDPLDVWKSPKDSIMQRVCERLADLADANKQRH